MNDAEKKHVEETRKMLVRDWEARNAALEDFALTISHDLKAPLTVMSASLMRLREDIAAGDLQCVEEDIKFAEKSLKRMSSMSDDILRLFRIGREETPSKPTPIRDIATEIADQFRPLLEESQVSLTVHPDLPHVYMSEFRIREIVTNLVENAIKYIGDHPDPNIEIGCRIDNDEPVFFVRDNGVGIQPHYHDAIFGLFSQVNKNREGNGVGLALVKRIIESHGGRIWIESEGRGKGTTFCFTVPVS